MNCHVMSLSLFPIALWKWDPINIKPKSKVSSQPSKKGKKKKDSPRKDLLKKRTAKKYAVSEEEQDKATKEKRRKPKAAAKFQHLPLSERQIYHGRNFVPMTDAKENECECGFEWINEFSKIRIDEISDLNNSEKVLMSLWNTFLDRY